MPIDRETQKALLRKVIDKLQENQEQTNSGAEKTTQAVTDFSEKANKNLDDILKSMGVAQKANEKGKGDKAEEDRERRTLFQKIGDGVSSLKQGASNVAAAPGNLIGKLGDKVKGFSGTIMGLMKGAGSFILPIVAVAGLMSTGLFNAEKFKSNVLTILSIGQEVGAADIATLLAFKPAMQALSQGLLAFGLGSAAAGGVDAALEYFGAGDWASKIKGNVLTLLSIGQEVGLADIATLLAFKPAMTALAVGLAAFGIGSGIAAVGDLIGFDASTIKENVLTLLSIGSEVGLADIGTLLAFAPAMTALGVGLAAFGVGSGVAAVGQLLGFDAHKLKDQVLTLLSIPNEVDGGALGMLGEAGAVTLALGGLGVGLAAFGVGSAITAIAQFFSKPDFAENVKSNVLTLLSIGDVHPDADEKAAKVRNAMGSLSAGLALFSGGNFVSALANAATGIVNFFTGGKSPIDQMLSLAEKDAEIASTERNISRMVTALERFSSLNMTGPTIDFSKLMRGVAEAIPFIQALGGTHPDQEGGNSVKVGTLGSRIEIGPHGILDEGLKIPEISEKIAQVQGALGYNVNVSGTGATGNMSMAYDASNEQAFAQLDAMGGTNNNVVDASTTVGGTTNISKGVVQMNPEGTADNGVPLDA